VRALRLLFALSLAALFWGFVGGFAYSLALHGRLPRGSDPLLGAREAAARRDLPAALVQYEMAQRLSPDDLRIAVEHGDLLAANRRFDAAAERFLFALERQPDDARALSGLADARRGQGRPREALVLYEHALARAPGNAGVAQAIEETRRELRH
jgi:tetratricopeptide (TPR) repeat protein